VELIWLGFVLMDRGVKLLSELISWMFLFPPLSSCPITRSAFRCSYKVEQGLDGMSRA
jgi:hypothetical protein